MAQFEGAALKKVNLGMAVHFVTKTPKRLLAQYKKAVDEGHVETWSYDSDGDFTHTASQWENKAWLRPKIREGEELVMYILAPLETTISSETYAVFHGRFIESMLAHCETLFVTASASAMTEVGDVVSS